MRIKKNQNKSSQDFISRLNIDVMTYNLKQQKEYSRNDNLSSLIIPKSYESKDYSLRKYFENYKIKVKNGTLGKSYARDFSRIESEFVIPFLKSDLDLTELLSLFNVRIVLNILSFFAGLHYFEICQNHILKRKFRGDMAPINSMFLRRNLTTFGNDFAKVFLILEKLGYITVSPIYKTGHYPMAYKLNPARFGNVKWEKTDFKTYCEEICPEVKKEKHRRHYYTLWNRFNYFRNKFLQLKDGKIKEILKRAHEIVSNVSVVAKNKGKSLKVVKKTCSETAYEKHEKIIAAHNARGRKHNLNVNLTAEDILKSYDNSEYVINNKLGTVKVHDHHINGTGRIYTSITNLKREFREFLRYKETQEFINVDLRCSQPSLLPLFYKPEDQSEKDLFVSFIQNKDLYAELSAGTSMSREEAKTITFVIMFAPNRLVPIIGKEIYAKFEELFPILSKRLFDKKRNNYKRVAFEMQSKESEIMIYDALHHLTVTLGLDCLSIHDSIMTLPENLDITRETILNAFYKEMGFMPALKED